MEQNTNPEINRLNMEASKKAADNLRGWAGLDTFKKSNGGSYLNGSTAQSLNESKNEGYTPGLKPKNVFEFGVATTVSALKNSSLYELPAGKIMLEKFDFMLGTKGVPEAFLVEGFIQELSQFSWEESGKTALENMEKILESNRKEIEVVKVYENIKSTSGRDLFSDATTKMENWLVSESRNTDSLISGLKGFGFNPAVRNLISFLSLYENKNSGKFSVGYDNENCTVGNIYSPIHLDENGSTIFFAGGKFFKLNEESETIEECQMDEVPPQLRDKVAMVSDRDVKIGDNKIALKVGDHKIEIVFEGENKVVLFNGNKINESDLPLAINASSKTLFENTSTYINKAMKVISMAEEIVEIDFGKSIKSRLYEGAEANIFKFGKNLYVQTVNPSMKLNKVYECNGTQAIKIVKDFIKYDISESLTEFLEGESAILSIMKNDKKAISENITLLENELTKIERAKSENPRLAGSKELIELQEGIENEISSLKDRWNQINTEISRFSEKAKDISQGPINEEMGYPLDTEVRVKRNGSKGTVIGVDGNSKTYTILFKEGKTGEYFFSDVEDISDEVEKHSIETPEIDLDLQVENEYEAAFEKAYQDQLVKAPGKSAATPSKFIEDEGNASLAETPEKGSKVKDKKVTAGDSEMAAAPAKKVTRGSISFIESEENANLAKAPQGSIKKASTFIEDMKNHNLAGIKESQKNSHIEKAPKGEKGKAEKFVEDEDNANLADAHGNSKKDGKKFVEDLERADLSEAPKAKKK